MHGHLHICSEQPTKDEAVYGLSFRADNDLQRDCGQEDSVHQPCLPLQGPFPGKPISKPCEQSHDCSSFPPPLSLSKVNKMVLEEQSDDGDTLKFIIRSNDPAREELRIVCQAEDARNKAEWVGIMKRQLQTQMDFLRALQAPIAYHNKLPKE